MNCNMTVQEIIISVPMGTQCVKMESVNITTEEKADKLFRSTVI